MKKYVNLLFALCLLPMAMFAQDHNTVEFNYDDAGNRTLRHTIYVPETIVKAGDIIDTIQKNTFEETIPVDEVSMGEITVQIFPNPTRGRFKVRLNNLAASDQVTYALYALTGQILFKGAINTTETELDLQDYENGSYLFKLVVNSQTTTWTIIKR
ncbi:MAG: T9SS type A sorting domain-containing protein [Bacteroidetes bacterium]|nr:T9SS type A sorting domain-containing protein [Bacteroidota bacterium]